MTDTEHHPVAIVGSGPAGYTAAIYASRAGLDPIVFEGGEFGGSLMTTTTVENFPGFPEGVGGADLMMMMREQAERFGAIMIPEDVTEISVVEKVKTIRVGDRSYTADAVVLAMGSAVKLLGLAEEEALSGQAFFYCATCDGFPFQGKEVVVVGGGDSAMEEAVFLAGLASRVTIVHRSDTLRASAVMVSRARALANIEWRMNTLVETVSPTGEGASTYSVSLRDTTNGSLSTLETSAVFVAVGHVPRSALVREQIPVDDDGYVLTSGGTTITGLDGVFAAGDLVDRTYRQAVTAAGTGCAAALDAGRYLSVHRQSMSVIQG